MYLPRPFSICLSVLVIAIVHVIAFASTGTIVAPHQYAWNDNGGYVNWLANGGNVTVSDAGLSGYIWSAGFGWINLSPTNGGVTNNNGTLSGDAWGTNTGYIDFTGVSIDSNGLFHGHTVAQPNFGTMTFDCTNCYVITSWRAKAASSGSGGGGTVSASGAATDKSSAPQSPPLRQAPPPLPHPQEARLPSPLYRPSFRASRQSLPLCKQSARGVDLLCATLAT